MNAEVKSKKRPRSQRFYAIFLSIATLFIFQTISTTHSQIVSADALRELKQKADALPSFYKFPLSSYANLQSYSPDVNYLDQINKSSKGDVVLGLRVDLTNQTSMQKKLASVLKTGDIVLTYRPDSWAGAGPYTNIQLGVSHAGMIYFDNGVMKNIDNPLNSVVAATGENEYVGSLSTDHYRTTKFLHVIRPRFLEKNPGLRKNLDEWAKIFVKNRAQIYSPTAPTATVAPGKLAFNTDYGAPNYIENPKGAADLTFVETLALIGLSASTENIHASIKPPKTGIKLFCSEFVWSLLALANCNPNDQKIVDDFDKGWNSPKIPKCISMPFTPMNAISKITTNGNFRTVNYIGLAEGPVAIIDQHLRIKDEAKRKNLIDWIFEKHTTRVQLSSGHRTVAEQMDPFFKGNLDDPNRDPNAPLIPGLKNLFLARRYSLDITNQNIMLFYNTTVKANYSPTAFILNTFLPKDHKERTMDYVETLYLTDSKE